MADWFHARGYDIQVVFFYDRDGIAKDYDAVKAYPIITLDGWTKEISNKRWLFFPRGLIKLYFLMRRGKFDSILTFTHHGNLIGIPFAWLSGIKIRLATHLGRILGFKAWQEKLHTWLINSKLTTGLIANFEDGKTEEIQKGVNPEKVKVVHIWGELPERRELEKSDLLISSGLSDADPLIISAGRLTYEKGFDLLLDAIPNVIQKFPDAKFALCGDGFQREDLEKQARDLGVLNHVKFLGFRSDVAELMMLSDIYVLPSRSEGMPNAIMEAMSLELPVIAFSVGGIPELIIQSQTGILIKPQDVDALSQGIIDLINDPGKGQKLGQAARRTIREKYNLEEKMEIFEVLLAPQAVTGGIKKFERK
ncbi:MAG: glycosyltransferase [Anaerolineaceae bacterium]|nr:glycosyltransferase [Anaerolineaceae bacterium]